MPRPLSRIVSRSRDSRFISIQSAWPATASSIELSRISAARWCSARSSVPPIYMPGRWRTGSSPSRTSMFDASYPSADAAAPKRSAICHKSFAIAPAADPAPRRTPEKTGFFYRILRPQPRQTARYGRWRRVKVFVTSEPGLGGKAVSPLTGNLPGPCAMKFAPASTPWARRVSWRRRLKGTSPGGAFLVAASHRYRRDMRALARISRTGARHRRIREQCAGPCGVRTAGVTASMRAAPRRLADCRGITDIMKGHGGL